MDFQVSQQFHYIIFIAVSHVKLGEVFSCFLGLHIVALPVYKHKTIWTSPPFTRSLPENNGLTAQGDKEHL